VLHISSRLSTLGLIRVAQRSSLVLGLVLTVTFVTVAMVGTTLACWLGSLAVLQASGVDSTLVVRFLCASCALVGFAAEMFKLGLATKMSQQGCRCPTVVIVLWVSCVTCAWLMPVLLLAHAPIWPRGGGLFVSCAGVWAFVQLASGLAPAVHWSASSRQTPVNHPSSMPTKQLSDDPGACADPGAGAAGERLARLDVDAVFALLCDLVFHPDAALGARIRIKDCDIAGSQRDLAHHLGLPRSTLRRYLHRLEGQGRLSLSYSGEGTTHIKLHLTRV
jgi:IclR helix-turn-helix domain